MLYTFTPRFMREVSNWLLVTSFMLLGVAAQAALNDTGITTCSNETQNGLPCPVAGFPGQDAEYGTNSFDFTKLDANGNAMAVTATNHSCVKDNVTGLIWEVKTDDGGLRDKDNTYTFDQAATFAANVNATNLCGHTDWRMPDIKELASIVDYSIPYPGPTIDEDYFPNTPAEEFWSASPIADGTEYAWIVGFGYGDNGHGYRASASRARLVCAGQSLSFVFTDNANGTITDSSTGLIWAKCPLGQFGTNCEIGSASALTWAQALNAAKDSTLAGRNDWRVPNIQELRSIVDYTKYDPSINSTYFPNTPAEWFWSASPSAYGTAFAWIVLFYFGDDHHDYRNYTHRARLVCAGQVLSFALNVAKAGNGAGSVLSNPAGINCGSDCNENYASGTSVTLTATPAAGSAFSGWGGACTGTTTTCSITMDAAKSTTATFNLPPKPDFTIPVMTITPAVPVTNGTFTATVTVKNQGTVAADGGQLRLWANQATAPACAATGGDKNVAVGTIAAGSSKTFTITGLNAGVSGLKTLRAFVDATCAKVESNETNNQHTLSYRVAGRKADFVVTAITLIPTTPTANGTFTATVTVKNQGNLSADGGYLDVWANQSAVPTCGAEGNQFVDLGFIAAGTSKVVTINNLIAGNAGTKTARAFVDSWCEFVESNETNNQLIKSYSVQ